MASLTRTRTHVSTWFEKDSCLFVRANDTLFNLFEEEQKIKRAEKRGQKINCICERNQANCGRRMFSWYGMVLTLVLDWTVSLHKKHFLTLGEQIEQVQT